MEAFPCVFQVATNRDQTGLLCWSCKSKMIFFQTDQRFTKKFKMGLTGTGHGFVTSIQGLISSEDEDTSIGLSWSFSTPQLPTCSGKQGLHYLKDLHPSFKVTLV